MRLIDADAVIEELRQIYNDCDDWETHISQSDLAESEKRILTNRASATKMAMIEVRLRVDKIPSADVVERKKGEWMLVNDNRGQHYICNCCGEWKYHQEQNYCGHCGADMRKEKDNE